LYDSIIIGKGPAGITAAIYLKRAKFNCLVIGKDEGNLARADKIENYYGVKENITGLELINKGIEQAKELDVEITDEEVISIEDNGIFKVKTRDNMYESKSIVIATGVNRKKPIIKGIKEFEGKGISYCAICDAFFYKNKDVAILGNGDYALNEAKELLPIVNSITVLTNGKELVQNRDITVNEVTKEIKAFNGDRYIENVEFVDNTKMNIDGIFIAEGIASSTDLARRLGVITDKEHILVNDDMETNVKNVYAAGDCTGGILQIPKAVYQGMAAGLSIIRNFREGGK